MAADNLSVTIKVWDLPTRIFHWATVLLVAACWWTASGDGDMDKHLLCGYAVLTLLLFRLVWGVVGSTTARFAHFVRAPAAVLEYFSDMRKTDAPPHIGHNPAGGWMVLALLGMLLLIAGSGLFANDDILTEGPLAHFVGTDLSDLATAWHERGFYILLALVGLHLGAILFYLLVKKENLVRPMFSGIKFCASNEIPRNLRTRGAGWAVPVLCCAALLVWWLAGMGVATEF